MEVRMTPTIATTDSLALPLSTQQPQAGQYRGVSESIRLAAVTDRNQDITLTTKEGDTVTLSLDQSAVVVYGRDGRLSRIRQYAEDVTGSQASYENLSVETREWLGIEASREFTLSIDGDLNEAEMRDIRKALQRIDHLMGRTFGVDSAAMTKTPGLSGLDRLDGIEVEIQTSRTILAARSTRVSALSYSTGGQAAPDVDNTVWTSDRPVWQTAADEAVGVVAETRIAPQYFTNPLRNLFRHWTGRTHRHHQALEPMVRRMATSVFKQLGIMPQDATLAG
jgi:hypothetical protein